MNSQLLEKNFQLAFKKMNKYKSILEPEDKGNVAAMQQAEHILKGIIPEE